MAVRDERLSVVLIPEVGPMRKLPGDDSLAAMQALVGYVEVVRLPDNQILLVDEEARLRSPKPGVNAQASQLAGQVILGQAVLLRNSKAW